MPPEDSSTSSPQEPASDAPQPVHQLPTPAIEAPISSAEPVATPETPSAPETAPASAEATAGTQPATQTAQIPPNEPLPAEPEPFDSAQDKPTPAPESPSAAAPVQTGILHAARDFLMQAHVSIQDRKRKKRDKIIQALNAKNKITNDEVEKLLHVSDATATRYLSALEKEGKLRQVGKTGSGVVYQKI